MLIRFEVSNFRSIRESAELSMVAIDRDRPEARAVEGVGDSLLCVAGIFGPNASGKTNVLAALGWLCEAVAESVRSWDSDIPVERFAFTGSDTEPTKFLVEFLVDEVRFEYHLELDKRQVHYEGLFHYPEGRSRRVFERDGLELKLQRGLGRLSGVRQLLTSRVLVLSLARRFDEPLTSAFARRLVQTQGEGGPLCTSPGHICTDDLFADAAYGARFGARRDGVDEADVEHDRPRALALLRRADLGIADVRFVDDPKVGQQRRELLHRVGHRQSPLSSGDESDGTNAWYELIGPLVTALRQGSILLVDELDAHRHPSLSAQVVRIFHNPATNPSNAQLIFTTHDTSLLYELNRDEVWLTEKDEDGATTLGALAEFAGERVRKSQNLGRAYLSGRFGALPEIDDTDFHSALEGVS